MARNAPILRDAKTHEELNKTSLKVLYSYLDRSTYTVDQLMDEIEWEHFGVGGSVYEASGVMGGATSCSRC